ncbi:3-oxoadipate enol-lactonase [Janthinobacterium sp. BJB1]|nr:3-oxoadipate enol-lactonase [Janthinobacterium sp. BJB303]PJC98851.1 3-oxoadipate enol-lactonase [Janthinobacterium sp. BJB1]
MTHTGNDTAGKTCEVDGIGLHYRTDGERGKPCLLLSNSLGTDLSMWDVQAAALAGDFFVVRYDTRGHGQSAGGGAPFGIERLGLDVVALLDHLDIARAAFCGISMGGLTGQWLGIHQPRRLTQLVLANTAARIGAAAPWQLRAEQVRRDGMAAVADGAAARWFTPQLIAREPDTVARMTATLRSQDAGGYAACCEALAQADLRAQVATIAVPTLIIAGEHDLVTTVDDGRWLQQRIAGSRLASVPASHISNVEAADLFTAQLRTFLL